MSVYPHNEMMRDLRRKAFADDADPLYLKWQRGEGTEQEWLDAVASVRDRYPYVDVVA
jgi:hypothetical protein